MYQCPLETPWGAWHLTATEHGVASVVSEPLRGETCWNPVLHHAVRELTEYACGRRTEFTVPLDPLGTPFQKQVWKALQTVGYGETAAYAQIAAQIGKPKAVRAVGQAVGRNPCLILIPCHRIIGKNGSLTGFSAGMALKVQLLALERQKERKNDLRHRMSRR